MPGFVTHYLFGVDAYKRIENAGFRHLIAQNHSAFALGLQGPDLFFYYAPSYFIHEKNIGNIAHEKQTNLFFKNLMEGRNLFLEDTPKLNACDAYICGFLGHYTLDTTTHPFVYAFTNYNPYLKKQPGYFGRHTYYETDMDNELLWVKKQQKPTEFHQNSTLQLTTVQKKAISELLAYAYTHTYPDIHVTKQMVLGAIRFIQTGTHLVNDPSGQKKVAVRFVEQKLFGHAVVSTMLPSDTYQFHADPMNYSHRTWIHPWTKEASRTSFIDLYEEAEKLLDKRLSLYYDMVCHGFTEGKKKAFLSDYQNRSFTSGLNQNNP